MIHKRLMSLAVPMILTNITTPLLGLVDTAVLGHLSSAKYLAAAALGSLIFSFIFWGFGFLRMGTTALTATAVGAGRHSDVYAVLFRALFLSLVIAVLILVFSQVLAELSFFLLQGSLEVKTLAREYFNIRILSTPATLAKYALVGWLIGRQNVRIPFFIVLVTNLSNIILDIYLVTYLNLKIDGVALATVLAEYLGLFTAITASVICYRKHWQSVNVFTWFQLEKIKAMLQINSHIFIRTLCLIFAFAFFTYQGAEMGELILSANAVLLNFQTFMAFALDGFAHAAETLTGAALGGKKLNYFKRVVATGFYWSFCVAMLFVGVYAHFGMDIIDLLTDISSVRDQAYLYLPWLVLLPVLSFICYVFDGVFIGAMLTREMRNTMIFSLFMVFFPVWYFSQSLQNHGLWLALSCFMIARSLSMSLIYFKSSPLKSQG